MSGCPLIVLKFGGSVLANEDSLALAVHEIYRWRRDGYRIVAVVSALAGVTDGLLDRARQLCERAAPTSIAALIAIGELHSAALLGLHLDRAGIPASVLPPSALKLVADGPALDATPRDVCTCVAERALERDGVVVVPGYVAEDAQGRAVVLGRGGSDLTALFLAHRLGAGLCRLVKDVDGLYDRDPALPGPPARRYATARWVDALATDGSIVQHKAVRFAAAHGIQSELGGFNGNAPTRIGRGPTTFAEISRPQRRLRVALLGLGTVGVGVYHALRRLDPLVELVSVVVRDVSRPRPIDVPAGLLSNSAESVAEMDVDLLIEVMGGLERASAAAKTALARGVHVVTANKRLIAERGDELRRIAASNDCLLRFSAAVGGSTPLLERIYNGSAVPVRSIRAVLNGTTNFVLDRVADGSSFEQAVHEAHALGLAEADPSRDLDGRDAADKLCVLAGELGVPRISPDRVHREPLTPDAIVATRGPCPNGRVVRHVASLCCNGGLPDAAVRLLSLDQDDPLADVHAEQNAAVIQRVDGSSEVVRGKGAGRWPTAEAVIADVLDIVRATSAERDEPGEVLPHFATTSDTRSAHVR